MNVHVCIIMMKLISSSIRQIPFTWVTRAWVEIGLTNNNCKRLADFEARLGTQLLTVGVV
jgi:hypothetical protein